MNENTQTQIVDRLKREPCRQDHCLSNHQDNVQIIVFNNQTANKTGLMCTACFLDSQLIQQLMPVEKYALPIRKYMSLIVSFYQEYLKIKESNSWGPTLVQKQGEAAKRKIELFYNQGLKSVLQISNFAQSISRKAIESLRKVYQDSDFDKVVQFLNEQNQIQQQRIILSNQLSSICSKIKIQEGKVKYATEEPMRKEAEEIITWYRQQVSIAASALKELVQVHKITLKGILG